MKKLLAVLLLCLLPLQAQAQQSKAAITAEINTNWPDNTSGAITPAILRSTVTDIVVSYVDWLTCTVQGGILYWNAVAAPSCLVAGTSGYVLKTQGAGANPTWAANTASLLTMSTDQRLLGRAGSTGAVQELSQTTALDWIYATQGGLLYRDTAAWAGLAPTTAGYLLKTQGAGANPAWVQNTASVITMSTGLRFIGNNSSTSALAQELSATGLLDWIGATRGSVLYRGANAWTILTPGVAGTFLQSNGAGADPSYAAVAGSGTVTFITCSTGISCSSNPISTTATISVSAASQTQMWAGTAGQFVDAAQLRGGGGLVALTMATPTVAVDFSLGVNYSLALTGSTQLGNPSDMTPGLTGCIFITKDATTRTLSYNSSWKFAGGTAPTLSTSTTTVPDVLCYLVRNSTFVWGTLTQAIN